MSMEKITNGDEKDLGFSPSATAELLSPEELELAKLGYKQEFTREFSWLATFSFAFSISGLLATVSPRCRCHLRGPSSRLLGKY
jgi:hypothetical protein